MAKLDLSALDDLFSSGEDFELTAVQYEQMIGKPMPKSMSGIKGTNAPLARKANEKGYAITSVADKPIIMKTVKFSKVKRGN